MLIDPTGGPDDEVRDWNEAQTQRWGYLPNYAAAFASRPDVARAWDTLNVAVRDGMDRRRFELATIAAAQELRSTYCTVAHSKFLRDVCGDEAAMMSLFDPEGGTLDETDRAVVAFARKVATDAASIAQSDVDTLREAGLSDNDVADVVFAIGARCFFATVVEGFGVNADHQLGATFDLPIAERLTVGRPIGAAPDA